MVRGDTLEPVNKRLGVKEGGHLVPVIIEGLIRWDSYFSLLQKFRRPCIIRRESFEIKERLKEKFRQGRDFVRSGLGQGNRCFRSGFESF